MAKKQDEVTTLLAGPVQIGNYQVRSWTLKRFAAVYPIAAAMVQKLIATGLTLDNLEGFIREKGLGVLPELVEEIPPLLAASLDIPLAEAEELDWGTAAAITLTIFSQNLEPLKNFLALIPQITPAVRASIPSR